MNTRICSVSIDLDPIECYTRIHDIEAPEGPDAVYMHALPRFLELFDEMGIRATFFVVGSDAREPEHAAILKEAVARGHELANHSLSHPYNLPGLSSEDWERQVAGGHDAIREGCGVDCVGFRAPGYNIDARTLELIERLGYTYDSSVFPCPPYYLAKAAVMGLIRVRGGRSGSAMVDPATQLAPTRPYRPRKSAIHRRASNGDAAGVVELPMCVLPIVRWPVIGTSLILAGPRASAAMMKVAARHHKAHLNIELHGIDLSDATRDGIDPRLVERQPDLRRTLDHKLRTFRAAFEAVSDDYQFLPCREAVEQLALA